MADFPEARIRAYNDGDPVNPQDLNLIQDAIIAGMHGELTLVLPPAAFVPRDVGGEFPPINSGVDLEWPGGGVGYAHAAIPVPVGTTIKSVTISYDRGGAGTMAFSLLRLSGSVNAAVANTGNIIAGTGETTVDMAAIDYIIPADTAVYIQAEGNNVANVLYHALVVYSKTT
jgi:hypothetical protein